MEIYLSIDPTWFEKNKERLIDHAQELDPNCKRKELSAILERELDNESIEVSDDMKMLSIYGSIEGVFVDINVPIDESVILQIFEIAIKRLNKMRSAIEALK